MKKTLFLFSSLIVLAFSIHSCFVMDNVFTTVAPGYWRGVLELSPKDIPVQKSKTDRDKIIRDIEEFNAGELPFTFEVVYTNDSTFYIDIVNGEERIRVEDISTRHDNAKNADTVRIEFPIYGTYIEAAFEEKLIEGLWHVPYRGNNYSIPFKAKHGQNHRFSQLKKEPVLDLTGKWKTIFDVDKEADAYPAIGEFKQEGNHLSGTFSTETGDYRFLEGTIQGNKAYLSCFDGSHAFLFEAKVLDDGNLIGSFRSGSHYRSLWEASKDDNFQLANPDTLTYLKEGYDQFDFSFKNSKGKTVTLNDPEYQNKAKIVQILGTWCPNCRDETTFLVEYLQQNPSDDVAVIGIAFERYREEGKAFQAIQTYREKMKTPYEILHGGYFNKKEAAEALPMLNHILSYPTMIFLDRDNKVRRIHTGFAGPATSQYAEFKKEFKQTIQEITTAKTLGEN